MKKKSNKAQASKSIESPAECDDTATKKTKSSGVAVELSEQKGDSDPIVEFIAPKPTKSKKKAPSVESSSSKESSVEKDLVMITAATASMTVAAMPATTTTSAAEPLSKSKKKNETSMILNIYTHKKSVYISIFNSKNNYTVRLYMTVNIVHEKRTETHRHVWNCMFPLSFIFDQY